MKRTPSDSRGGLLVAFVVVFLIVFVVGYVALEYAVRARSVSLRVSAATPVEVRAAPTRVEVPALLRLVPAVPVQPA